MNDLSGRLIEGIYSGQAVAETTYTFKVNVKRFTQGVYIYKLTTDSEVKTVKFLKN